MVASNAAVESVSSNLNNLFIATGTAYFDGLAGYTGSRTTVTFPKAFPVDNPSVTITLNSEFEYWADINIVTTNTHSNSFEIAIWNASSHDIDKRINIDWQAIYDGRN